MFQAQILFIVFAIPSTLVADAKSTLLSQLRKVSRIHVNQIHVSMVDNASTINQVNMFVHVDHNTLVQLVENELIHHP